MNANRNDVTVETVRANNVLFYAIYLVLTVAVLTAKAELKLGQKIHKNNAPIKLITADLIPVTFFGCYSRSAFGRNSVIVRPKTPPNVCICMPPPMS